jgi:serine/threonine-protein kinase
MGEIARGGMGAIYKSHDTDLGRDVAMKVLQEGGVADERPVTETQVSIIETVRSGSTATGSQSLAGSILGTPAYMPPEQAQGRIDQVDERADVFGLGAILCEIFTGAPPYIGKHDKVVVEATKALQDNALERLAACGADAELVELVTDCIAPARTARPADAAEVLERVQACLVRQEQRAREADEAALRAEQERKARRLTLALAAGDGVLGLPAGHPQRDLGSGHSSSAPGSTSTSSPASSCR